VDARQAYEDVTAALREAYDRSAGDRDRAPVASWKDEERRRFLDALRAAGARTLLEVGAGTGKDGLFFREHGLDVTCTDLSPAMVALCRAKGLRGEVRDVLHLGLQPASFDAVYAFNCLLHVPKRALSPALASIREVLRPGGLFFLGLYGGPDAEGVWPDDWHEPKRFFAFHTDDGICRAVGAHFDLLAFRPVTVGRNSGQHFQSLLLRRPPAGEAAPVGG
jgi:SAM-dependent methyltransferase